MENLFFTYLDAGVSGSVIIIVGILLRPIFRKVPRRILCVVWLLAALRLLLPFSIESPFSLQPNFIPAEDLVLEQQYLPEFSAPEEFPEPEIPDMNPVLPNDIIPPEDSTEETEFSLSWEQWVSVFWVTGSTGIVAYCVASYIMLKRKTRTAVLCGDGVLESEYISGAFLLGYFKPRIYLPVGLSNQDRAFIIAHEKEHTRCLDHWWKLVGVLCVALHWYNPLVWVAYALLCRDIEITCDERVIQGMPLSERKAYTQALLNSEKRRFGILECPVAFGEVDLKQRIRNVLTYHPYGYWLTSFAIALVVFVAFCFMTSPVTQAVENLNSETIASRPTEPGTAPPADTTPATSTPPNITEPLATQPPATTPLTTAAPTTTPSVTVVAQGYDFSGKRTFRLTSDGTLTIYGTAQYSSSDTAHWKAHADLITKIVMKEGCTMVSEESFQDLDNLIEVYLCETLELIGAEAFYDCDSLQYIRIPANVAKIETMAFASCSALSKVEFSTNSKLTEIESYAFSNTALSSFSVPTNLKLIGRYAFYNCWRLQTVILRGSIESVGADAFNKCTQLNHVVLGETLAEASRIFKECGEIETVENYSHFPFEDFL